MTSIFFNWNLRLYTLCNILSKDRIGLSFTIAAGPRQRSRCRIRFHGTHNRILLSQIRDFNLEGQVPVFMSSRNRVAQLYPEALGFLFVVSYDLHSYGGGIRTHLHKEWLTELYCL
jgi:hypothetical protein